MSNTAEIIISAIENITGKNGVTEDMAFGKDIVLTSVNAMRMIYELETALGIDQIPLDIVYEVETVGELITAMENLK